MDDRFFDRLKALYAPPENQFTVVDVPPLRFLVIEGTGDPAGGGIAEANKWLWSIAFFLLPLAKERMEEKFAYPPLECQFWTDDPQGFRAGTRDKWHWRVMVILADWMTEDMIDKAIARAEEKRGSKAPPTLGIDDLKEGKSVQIMHVGTYDEVRAICDRLYGEFLPGHDLTPNGRYHEIYLNDPSRTMREKRKIVIRQPVE